MRPLILCSRHQGAVTAPTVDPSLPLLFSLHHDHSYTWQIAREETRQTLLLSTRVIHSWVSRINVDTGDGITQRSRLLSQRQLASIPPHPVRKRVDDQRNTVTSDCHISLSLFHFQKNARVDDLITGWKYIVCNYHWENTRNLFIGLL